MNTYSTYRIRTGIYGTNAVVEFETNDDDDDGYPDGEVVRAEYRLPSLDRALAFTGKSRHGLYGQPVNVYLNGERI